MKAEISSVLKSKNEAFLSEAIFGNKQKQRPTAAYTTADWCAISKHIMQKTEIFDGLKAERGREMCRNHGGSKTAKERVNS